MKVIPTLKYVSLFQWVSRWPRSAVGHRECGQHPPPTHTGQWHQPGKAVPLWRQSPGPHPVTRTSCLPRPALLQAHSKELSAKPAEEQTLLPITFDLDLMHDQVSEFSTLRLRAFFSHVLLPHFSLASWEFRTSGTCKRLSLTQNFSYQVVSQLRYDSHFEDKCYKC